MSMGCFTCHFISRVSSFPFIYMSTGATVVCVVSGHTGWVNSSAEHSRESDRWCDQVTGFKSCLLGLLSLERPGSRVQRSWRSGAVRSQKGLLWLWLDQFCELWKNLCTSENKSDTTTISLNLKSNEQRFQSETMKCLLNFCLYSLQSTNPSIFKCPRDAYVSFHQQPADIPWISIYGL